MTSEESLDLYLTVFCDGIRREEYGKLTLVGVYATGTLGLGTFPAQVKTLFRLDVFRDMPPGDYKFEQRIYAPGSSHDSDKSEPIVVKESEIPIPSKKAQQNLLSAGDLGPIVFEEPGIYESVLFVFRDGERVGRYVRNLDVDLDERISPNSDQVSQASRTSTEEA